MTEPNDPTNVSDADPKALEKFEQQQAFELSEFEAKQRQELESFERKEATDLKEFEARENKVYDIKIDRTEYKVHHRERTGEELRHLPTPPIGPERDLFEVVPGGSDRKISNGEIVLMRDGLRFFTAPAQINPGLL